MIIHKLIARHVRCGDDEEFYLLQARDAIGWLERQGVRAAAGLTALDLGCGHGIFGAELIRKGWNVTFADETNLLLPQMAQAPFLSINLDRDQISSLGQYDLVICSNVLEHLANPERFIAAIPSILKPAGHFYLSWTNWLSPWGGHEFSPFHYLGARWGHLVFDRLKRSSRKHTPYQNLFPTSIGATLILLRRQQGLKLVAVAPRYFPELKWVTRIPVVREFLTWNCAILLNRR